MLLYKCCVFGKHTNGMPLPLGGETISSNWQLDSKAMKDHFALSCLVVG